MTPLKDENSKIIVLDLFVFRKIDNLLIFFIVLKKYKENLIIHLN